MSTNPQQQIVLRQGKLLVFTRSASPYFQCRIKLDGKAYVYKSLKTMDEAEARQLADDLYAEAKFKHQNGMTIKRRKFKNVADEYLAHLKAQVESGKINEKKMHDHRKVIERYFIPYFGSKQIDTITDSDTHRFQEWSEAYWVTGPGSAITYIEYQR